MAVPGDEKKKRYLDVDELANRSGLSPATIWRLKAAGKIPFYQPAGKGGRVTFPLDALERTGQTETPTIPRETADRAPPEKLPGPRPQWMSSPKPANDKQ